MEELLNETVQQEELEVSIYSAIMCKAYNESM